MTASRLLLKNSVIRTRNHVRNTSKAAVSSKASPWFRSFSSLREKKHPEALVSSSAENDKSKILLSSKEFQYLQRSPVPTDVFQKSLPRMPIPKLDKTCERYLASQKALTSPEAFANTERITKNFLDHEGKRLNDVLIAKDKANKHTSYISGPWNEMYLKDRRPVSFTHNPGISMIPDLRPEFRYNTPLRAANLLVSALRFHKSLRESVLLPDVFHLVPKKTNTSTFWNKVKWMPGRIATPLSYAFKVFPLDMSQVPFIAVTCSIGTSSSAIFSNCSFPTCCNLQEYLRSTWI